MPVVGAGGFIYIDLGNGGELIYLNKVWRTVTPAGNLSIQSVSTAIEKLRHGEVLNPKYFPYNVTITKIRLGYYEKGRDESQEYLDPAWLFRGTTEQGDPIQYYVYARRFANFTIYPSTEVTKYKPVYFSDTSETSPAKWYWDFGDGTNSTEQNPSHLYKTGGNFTVNLTVWNDMGSDTISREDYVHVYYTDPAPVASFTSNHTDSREPFYPLTSDTVQFTDQSKVSGNNTEWFWDFGDGTNSTEQNPVHTFYYIPWGDPDEGHHTGYTVRLTVIDDYGRMSSVTYRIDIFRDFHVDFIGEPVSGELPLNVTFTELPDELPDKDIDWRYWEFGDGSTYEWTGEWDETWTTFINPAPKNITHIYTSQGNYTVSLTKRMNELGCCTRTREQYIHIGEYTNQLVADFTANVTAGRTPLAVAFSDTSGGSPSNWNWSLGDGTYSTDQNPIHIYTTAGTYTVSLTASNAYEENTTTKIDYISVFEHIPPAANFTANTTFGSEPLAVSYTDLSESGPMQWNWSFGDGDTSTEKDPVHTYASEGNYSVSLQVTNEYGSDTMFRPDYIMVIRAYPIVTIAVPPAQLPLADFTGTPVSGKVPLTVQFDDTSANFPSGWLWDFGDGTTATDEDPVYTYVSAGNYTVSLNASNEAGTNTTIKTDYITVLPLAAPDANFTAEPTAGKAPLTVTFNDTSSGSPTSWQWSFGDGATSIEQNPSHLYTDTGTYTVSLEVTNPDGSNTATKTDYISVTSDTQPPVAGFKGKPTCGKAPLTVKFNDTSSGSPTSWYWDFGDGSSVTEQNPVHVYTTAGKYTVSLMATNADGSNTSTRIDYITVSGSVKPPVANFYGKPTSGKAPLSVKFTDASTGSPTTWYWDFGDGTNATDWNPRHSFTNPGKYTVSLTVTNAGGSDTKTRTGYITVKGTPPPTANFYGKPTYGKAPLSVKFTDASTGSPTSWYWEFGDGTNAADRNPVHTYAVPGKYTVSLTAYNNAGNTTKTRVQYITVKGTAPTPTPTHTCTTKPTTTCTTKPTTTPTNTCTTPTPTHTCTPSQCEPHEVPLVTGSTTPDNKVRLDWDVITNPCLQGYKVVISKNNPNPKYPDDGYMFWITDRNRNYAVISSTDHYNGGDFSGYLQPGQSYYFSVTAVYSDKKVAGNVIQMIYPTSA